MRWICCSIVVAAVAVQSGGCGGEGESGARGLAPAAPSQGAGTGAVLPGLPAGAGGAATSTGTGTGTGTSAGAGGGGPSGIYFSESFDGPSVQFVFPSSRAWQAGRPRVGPRAAVSGEKTLAVRRRERYPNGTFAICHTTTIDLGAAARPVLVFTHWYEFEEMYDGGSIAVRHGSRVTRVKPAWGYPRLWVGGLSGQPGFSGAGTSYRDAWFDLSAFAGEANVQIVFEFGSDGQMNLDGWFVDDVMVAEAAAVEALWGAQRVMDAGAGGTVVFAEGFETPAAVQMTRSLGAASQWEFGPPQGSKFWGWVPQGTNIAGTRLARWHDPNVREDRLVTPFIDLAGARRAFLRFAHSYYAETRDDGGRVLASADGVAFYPVTPVAGYPFSRVDALHGPGFTGSSGGWVSAAVDLTPLLTSLGPRLQIAFEFASDHSRSYDGWAIDDIEVLRD